MNRLICHTAVLSRYGSRATFAAASRRPLMVSTSLRQMIKVPQMAESISEGTLKQWIKQKGDYVEADEEIATIETDKIDVSVNAPKAGTLVELFAQEDDTVSVGQDLCKIEEGTKPSNSKGGSSKKGSQDEPQQSVSKSAPASSEGKDEPGMKPKDSKLDASKASASSPSSSPLSSSNQSKQPQPQSAQSSSTQASSSKPPSPSSSKTSSSNDSSTSQRTSKEVAGSRGEERVKMNSMRRRIAERLKQSQNTAASLTTFNEIDMSALITLRGRYKDRILKEKGVKIGFMSAFAKASAIAMKEFPAVNAQIEGAGPGDTIVYRDYVDLSVAVATPKGLVTPVIRNVNNMTFLEIEQAIADAGKKARDGKLTLEDMSGGTFTISNGGVFGSLFGTPIINLPQTAVLGMHATKEKPVVVNGQIVIRPIMVVALTYDHRLLDGREAVSYLVRVKELIEDPGFMLLQ